MLPAQADAERVCVVYPRDTSGTQGHALTAAAPGLTGRLLPAPEPPPATLTVLLWVKQEGLR